VLELSTLLVINRRSMVVSQLPTGQPCKFGDQAKGSGEKSERPTKKSKKTSRVSTACLSATHLEKLSFFQLNVGTESAKLKAMH
jgi:hypothetical protein